jgi:hypothetical protein
MAEKSNLAGRSPEFDADDIDWALGELLHMIWQAKRAGCPPHKYNPLMFTRCMHVIGRQPVDVGYQCMKTILDTNPTTGYRHFHANAFAA